MIRRPVPVRSRTRRAPKVVYPTGGREPGNSGASGGKVYGALAVRLDEPFVVLMGIDADGRLADDADLDAAAQRQDAELFQFFQLFQRLRRQRGQGEQEGPAVGVQAEVLQEARRLGGEVGLAVADERDGAAAEVEGPAGGV